MTESIDEDDDNGTIIIDDLLTFMWCKITICPRDTLINCILSYYDHDVIVKSRELFFQKVPKAGSKRVKHRDVEKIVKAIYDAMQQIPTENPPVFAAPNINNLPVIDLANIDGASLVHNQNDVNEKINIMCKDQELMKKQLENIQKLLEVKETSVNKVSCIRQAPCGSITSDIILQQNDIVPSNSVPNTYASTVRKSFMFDNLRDNVSNNVSSRTANTLSSGSQESDKNVKRDFRRRQSQVKVVTGRKNGTLLNVVQHVNGPGSL